MTAESGYRDLLGSEIPGFPALGNWGASSVLVVY